MDIPPELYEPAYQMWSWLKSIDWAHLPSAGGLLDQDEGLMQAVMSIQAHYRFIKEETEMNEADAKAFGAPTGIE